MKIICYKDYQRMTLEQQTQYASEVMSAAKFVSNKCVNIGFNTYNNHNENTECPRWDWGSYFYYLLPEPPQKVWRPYKKSQIEWLGEAVINKISGDGYIIIGVYPSMSIVDVAGHESRSLNEMFDDFTWADGSPFGKLVEEEK